MYSQKHLLEEVCASFLSALLKFGIVSELLAIDMEDLLLLY